MWKYLVRWRGTAHSLSAGTGSGRPISVRVAVAVAVAVGEVKGQKVAVKV